MPDSSKDLSLDVIAKAGRGLGDLLEKSSNHYVKWLDKIGVTKDEWREAVLRNPHAALKLLREAEALITAGMPLVWDTLFDKAVSGDVAAAKLMLQRFDQGYAERTEVKHGFDDDAPDSAQFERVVSLRFGPAAWKVMKHLAKKDGQMGGVFGEGFLPGGDHEDMDEVDDLPMVLDGELAEPGDDDGIPPPEDLFG